MCSRCLRIGFPWVLSAQKHEVLVSCFYLSTSQKLAHSPSENTHFSTSTNKQLGSQHSYYVAFDTETCRLLPPGSQILHPQSVTEVSLRDFLYHDFLAH